MAALHRLEFRVEQRDEITVVRYSGTHACQDEDHQLDDRLREQLSTWIMTGRSRFLMDVRALHCVHGSSLGDVLNSWRAAIRKDGSAKVAILWDAAKPQPSAGIDRWRFLAQIWPKSLVDVVNLFTDEDEALTLLRSP